MLRKPTKYFAGWLIIILAVAMQACGVSETAPSAAPIQTQETAATVQATAVPASKVPDSETEPGLTHTTTVTISPTPAGVTVTAVNGNLSIRSGPDIVFDAVAVLEPGETVTAQSRSILEGWVQVPIPSQPGKTGWVSTKTNYAMVSGDVLDLPRIDIVEWPIGAYLRNCTPHRMLVKPGDQVLEPVSESPANRVWFSPGLYTVYDLEAEGQPVVMNLDLRSHSQVSLRKDGNGQAWSCE